MRKLLIVQILERWLLAGKNVPYKFLDDIASKLSTLHAVNRQFVCWQKKQPITQTAIAWTMDPKKGILDYILLHICANLWVKIPKFGGSKKSDKDLEKRNLWTQSPARPPKCITPSPK